MSNKNTGISTNELLRESERFLRSLKGKICRRCKQKKQLVQSGFCEECYREIDKEREARKKETRNIDNRGYVRVYDDDGKYVLEHRLVMSRHLGRELKKEEVIIWRDGDRTNNDLSNLMLGFKNGTPLENLICNECETKGNFRIDY